MESWKFCVLARRLNAFQTTYLKVQTRNKCRKEHWAELRRKKWPTGIALKHFDEFYGNVFGKKKWTSIRLALLTKQKYCAVLNNFSNNTEVAAELKQLGAIEITERYKAEVARQAQGRIAWRQNNLFAELEKQRNIPLLDVGDSSISDLSEPGDYSTSELLLPGDNEGSNSSLFVQPSQLQTASCDLISANMTHQNTNLVGSQSIIAGSSLEAGKLKSSDHINEFVPATELVGMDNWVDTDDYFRHYQGNVELPIEIVKEEFLSFPPLLKAFTFDKSNITPFPEPKVDALKVLGYYLMDAASLLPVLALDVKPHDKVLDMCAAPGGKSLAILQTLYPIQLVCNDISRSRLNRVHKVLCSYVPDLKGMEDRITVTNRDGREWQTKPDLFDKVLVDAPCSIDRISVTIEENNLFQANRLKDRVELPKLQTDLLYAALLTVRPGGTVVYSTCSLSPIQNDGVVHMALKRLTENTEHEVVVKDLSYIFRPLNFMCHLHGPLRYGHLVVPSVIANFGPMYIAKITRIK